MADQVIGQPEVRSLALAEPNQHVRVRWIISDRRGRRKMLVTLSGLLMAAAAVGVWKIKSVP